LEMPIEAETLRKSFEGGCWCSYKLEAAPIWPQP
jgi:hypothetical protein